MEAKAMKKYMTPAAMLISFEAKDIMVSSNENELVPDYVDNNLNIQDIQDI